MLSLTVPLVLASASPRRRHLLASLGLSFSVSPADVDETLPESRPLSEAVVTLARRKAAASPHPDSLVLAADTLVALGDVVLGKPTSAEKAATMLGALSGRTHRVFSGIAVSFNGRTESAYEATDVTFASLDASEIARYVASGSPMDKAGAYGIQDDAGALFVSGIRGDFYNVVGLPLHRLYRLLKESFPEVLR